ncbi:MAG TPA: hypothetical protein VNN73_13310 [Blastocatellia bacterium]|nr:hypothetical protein [Blastocatellia bacterium]
MGRIIVSIVTAIAMAAAAPALKAQEPTRDISAERERLRTVMDPATDIEEFRRELDSFYADLQASMSILLESEFARELIKRAGLDPLNEIAEARKKIPDLTSQNLQLLKTAFAKDPYWREIPERITNLLSPITREGLRRMRASSSDEKVFSFSAVTPSPVLELPGGGIHDNCKDAKLSDGSPRVSNSDISVAEAAVIAAEGVMEALPQDALTIEAHAIAAGVLAGAKAAALVLETFKNISDDCSDTDFQNYVTANLDEQVSTRSSQTSVNSLQATANTLLNKVDLVNMKLDDRLDVKVSTRASQDSVNNVQQSVNLANSKLDMANAKLDQLIASLAAFQAQNLRLQIEANMSNGTNDAAVGSFALPAAQGGFLELARSILVETIQKTQATGQGISNAQTYLVQGDQHRAAGRFREAYDSYRQAYRTVTGH